MTRRDERGFTIVEALVAFTILAVLGVALFRVFGDGAGRAREVELRGQAAMVARSALERVGPREIATLGTSENEEMAGFLTRVTVTAEAADEEALVELRRIEIVVLGPLPARTELGRITTFRLHSRVLR